MGDVVDIKTSRKWKEKRVWPEEFTFDIEKDKGSVSISFCSIFSQSCPTISHKGDTFEFTRSIKNGELYANQERNYYNIDPNSKFSKALEDLLDALTLVKLIRREQADKIDKIDKIDQ